MILRPPPRSAPPRPPRLLKFLGTINHFSKKLESMSEKAGRSLGLVARRNGFPSPPQSASSPRSGWKGEVTPKRIFARKGGSQVFYLLVFASKRLKSRKWKTTSLGLLLVVLYAFAPFAPFCGPHLFDFFGSNSLNRSRR